MILPRVVILAAAALALHSAEVIDPPSIIGWRYEHRAEHAIGGGLIDLATVAAVRHGAPAWSLAHTIGVRLAGIAAAFAAGVAKEAFDRAHGGEPLHHSAMDIAATTAGAVLIEAGRTIIEIHATNRSAALAVAWRF